MDYKEFLEIIQKKRNKKKFKISNSWGVHDALNYIRKNKWFNIGRPLKDSEFYSIIREVNNLLVKELAKGNDIKFPYGMGKIELRKIKRGVFINDKGNLVNTYPIDWESTLKLWYRDKEAKENKTIIRTDLKYTYKIHYNKFNANYVNQIFYDFAPNRFFKKTVLQNIKNNKVDTLW